MKKALITAEIVAGGLFVSSFFVKDNRKAVKRRWWALGIVGGTMITKLLLGSKAHS